MEELDHMTWTTYADVIEGARAETTELVHVERRDGRAIVRLDDPDKRNVLSAAAMTIQLHDALSELVSDETIAAIVLTGTDPAFSAGGDLRMMESAVASLTDGREGSTLMWRWIRRQFGAVVRLIAGSDTPVIAAVNGAAAGVGLAFVLACDIVVASEDAVLVPAFGRIGLIPEVGTSWLLSRRLGHQRAFAFYTLGEHVDARAAQELGLVTEVVPHEELVAAADRWCDRLCALPAYAPRMAKVLLRQAADMSWEQALTTEEFAEPSCFTTAPFSDAVNGMLSRARG
jgi:2-(1,2-epoxy-1,2-dihydrophenyl)acetyl-CoA isomerase